MNGRSDRSDGVGNGRAPASRPRWFTITIVTMVCLFAVTLMQRDRIRARWWAARLARTDDLDRRAYYLASLAAVGDAAGGAAVRLARDERPDVRALAVTLLARLPGDGGCQELRRLLLDDDSREVRESAALALSFSGTDGATGVLTEAAARNKPAAAAAAVAALARASSPDALRIVCRAAREHPHPLVRAQALESLVARLAGEPEALTAAATRALPDCDIVAVLVSALADQETFTGDLALEREIAAVSGFLQGRIETGAPASPAASSAGLSRTVAEVAADGLERLTGRPIEPHLSRSPQQLEQLTDRCRQWMTERSLPPGPKD